MTEHCEYQIKGGPRLARAVLRQTSRMLSRVHHEAGKGHRPPMQSLGVLHIACLGLGLVGPSKYDKTATDAVQT